MALTLKDRCKQKIAANAGTGSITLSTSVRGFKTISSALSNGDTSYFCLESANGDWEVFSGTYTASGTTISRDTVLASSNSGNKIDIGTSITFCYIVYPADKAVYKDGSNRAVIGAAGLIFSDASIQTTAATSPDLSPYLTSATAAATYAALAGSYSNPTWITDLAWSKITGTPTTLAGYGITDGALAASYVPYTGATGAVNLGTNGLTVGAITASGLLNLRNGLTPTQFQLHATYTSATSFGNLDIRANAGGTAYEISSFKGSAGGDNLPINIGHRDAAGTFTSALSVGITGSLSNSRGTTGSEYFGSASGNASSTGLYNTSFGSTSLTNITNGSSNCSFGRQSLQAVTSGSSNSGFGLQALNRLVSGSNNTAFGAYAGFYTTGSNNTYFGFSCFLNTAGSGNVGLGYCAGKYETGSNSFYIDNQDRTNTAGDKAGALLYGTFNATPTNQTLTINAATTVNGAITASGDLLFTDALYDIGKSGATRPRDGFFSRGLGVGSGADGVYFWASGTNSRDMYISNAINGAEPQCVIHRVFGISTGSANGAGAVNFYNGNAVSGTLWGTIQYDSANVFSQRNSTNAQTFRLSETWTSSTSFGALQFKANAGAAYQIGSAIGSAGGTSRGMNFGVWDAAGTFTSYLTLTNTTTNSVTIGVAGSTSSLQVHNNGSNIYYNAEGHYFRSLSGATSFFDITSGTTTARNNVVISQSVITSGSPTAFTITGAAHTTLATAEVTDGYFNAARTVNFTTTGGTVASQRTWRFTAPTFTAGAATTLTTASTVSISGPPVASTNVTITNPYALNVESGSTIITDGNLILRSTESAGSAARGGIQLRGWLTMSGADNYFTNQIYFNQYSCLQAINANAMGLGTYNATNGWFTGVTTGGFFWKKGLSYAWSNDNGANGGRYGFISDTNYIVDLRYSTNAHTFRVFNTYTSLTSGEWAEFNWQTTTNVLRMGTNKGSAGGSARDIAIVHGGTVVANFLSDRFYLGPITDGTTTGGNARGQYATDLQLVRSAANQVASGTSSFISGQYNLVSGAYSAALGYSNTVSGGGSFAAGYVNTITGNWNGAIGYSNTITGGSSGGCFATGKSNSINVSDNSTAFVAGYLSSVTNHAGFAHGIYGSSTRYNQYTHGGDFFLAALGGAQYIRLLAGNKTTTNTPINLMLDGSSTRLTIPSGKTMSGFLIVKGIKSDGSAKARFVRLCDITNVGGTTALDTPVEAIGTDYNPSGCTLAVTAEDATDDLQVNITAPVGETWRWVASFSGLEIAYGT